MYHKNDKDKEQEVNKNKWCFSYFAGSPHATHTEKAVLFMASQWPQRSKITISFMDGEPEVQDRVAEVALDWTIPQETANLTFEFRKDKKDTDIRISFSKGGSWSVLGTSCKNVPKDQPTMNLGWLDKDTDEAELRRVVLHEFGHALGLIHEHMSPADGGIKWNEARVRHDLSGPPNNWSQETIDTNMFHTFHEDELRTTPHLDRNSIMMYPVPAEWTTDGFSVAMNTELSEADKQFIRTIYR